MKVVRRSEGDRYEAEKHAGVWGIHKILAGRESRRLTVNLSVFLPGGGVEMSGSPPEKYYHVLEGTISVSSKSEQYTLEKGDGIYIAPDEEREMTVPGPNPCTLLVVIVVPN